MHKDVVNIVDALQKKDFESRTKTRWWNYPQEMKYEGAERTKSVLINDARRQEGSISLLMDATTADDSLLAVTMFDYFDIYMMEVKLQNV